MLLSYRTMFQLRLEVKHICVITFRVIVRFVNLYGHIGKYFIEFYENTEEFL